MVRCEHSVCFFQVNLLGNLNQPFQSQSTVPFGHQSKLLTLMNTTISSCECFCITPGVCFCSSTDRPCRKPFWSTGCQRPFVQTHFQRHHQSCTTRGCSDLRHRSVGSECSRLLVHNANAYRNVYIFVLNSIDARTGLKPDLDYLNECNSCSPDL